MWYYPISSLVNALASTLFGVVALVKNPHERKNRLYAFYCLTLSIWSYFHFSWQLSSNAGSALLLSRILMMGAIFIPVAHLHSVMAIFGQKVKRLLVFGYSTAIIYAITNFSPLFISHVEPQLFFRYWPMPGPVFHVYFIGFMFFLGYSLFIIRRAQRQATGPYKRMLSWLFWATLIGYGGGSTNFFLCYHVPIPPFGNILVTVYSSTVFYIITRYRLIDIQIIIRKTLLYSFVSAILACAYAGTVTLLAYLIGANDSFSLTGSPLYAPGRVTLHGMVTRIQLSFSGACIVTALFSVVFGLFVLYKGFHHRLNRLWSGVCFAVALWSFGLGMEVRSANFAEAYFWARWFTHIGAILIPVVFAHFILELLNKRSAKILIAGYGSAFFLSILTIAGYLVSVNSPAPFRYYAKVLPLYWLFLVYFFGLVLYTHGLMIRESFRAEGKFKKQLMAICVGTSVGFAGGATTFFPAYHIAIFPYGIYAVPLYIVTASYAIFKHQLMDISVVVRKTLLYSLVSAGLAAVYVGTITLLAHLLGERHGSASIFSSVLAAVFITLLFNPLRNRLQVFIDGKFGRSKLVGADQLVKLSSEVIGHEKLEKIAQSMGRILEESLHPRIWALYLLAAETREFIKIASASAESLPESMPMMNLWAGHFLATSEPVILPENVEPHHLAVAVPLMSGGHLLGYLLLGEKQSEEPYSDEDLVLLRIVANQATLAFERPKLLQEISGAFVHEIKTPLANIALPAELTFMDMEDLLKGEKSPEDLVPKIKKRMKYIMDQALLAGSRVEAVREATSRQEMVREPVRMGDVIAQCLQQLEGVIQNSKTQVNVRLNGEAPVKGDAKQLEVVFTNLIKNAVEAMENVSSDRSKEIHIQAKSPQPPFEKGGSEGGFIVITVKDTGPGIEKTHLPFLFKSNYTTKGANGAGMGLFLCRQIIEAHGGTIKASSLSDGAEFVITLPVA